MDMTTQEDFAALLARDIEAQGETLAAKPSTFAPQLQQILDTLQPLNFRELAGAKADEKVRPREMLVIAVRELLKIVEDSGAGLTASNGQPYAYNGHYWQLLSKEETQAFLSAAAAALGIDEQTAQYFETQDKLFK